MHRLMILIPLALAACAAWSPQPREPWTVEPVAMEDHSWAGCEAEGGAFHKGMGGRLVCVQ